MSHQGIPALPWPPGKHTATSFVRHFYKIIYLIRGAPIIGRQSVSADCRPVCR